MSDGAGACVGGAVIPPLVAGGVSAGADGGADSGGGLLVPLPLVPVLPASLHPVKAISANATKAIPVNERAREKDPVPSDGALP